MNRLLRPFGLKLGPLQAGVIYLPLHFVAVALGLTLLIAPQGVGVFWPASGTLFAFLLLYPRRYWPALLAFGFVAEIAAHTLFAPQIPITVTALSFFVKFASGLLGVWLMHMSVRGPISFARLHHVLGFAASAAASTLACAVVGVSLRHGLTLQGPRCATRRRGFVGRVAPRGSTRRGVRHPWPRRRKRSTPCRR